MCDWLAGLTTESNREAIWEQQRSHEKSGFLFEGNARKPLCISVFTLSAIVVKSFPFDLIYWSAHMCTAAIKGHTQSGGRLKSILLLLKWNAEKTSLAFSLCKQANSQTANDNCHSQTSANHQVILLSCDFLSFPFLHQKFRGQEDLSAVTGRIMGVGIPLAVITALSQHLVLSLPFFLHPLSFCLFSLLSSDRLRSN